MSTRSRRRVAKLWLFGSVQFKHGCSFPKMPGLMRGIKATDSYFNDVHWPLCTTAHTSSQVVRFGKLQSGGRAVRNDRRRIKPRRLNRAHRKPHQDTGRSRCSISRSSPFCRTAGALFRCQIAVGDRACVLLGTGARIALFIARRATVHAAAAAIAGRGLRLRARHHSAE